MCYPRLAVRAGINEALILQKLHFLIKTTETAKHADHFVDGRWWVYNTYAAWQSEHFPWLAVGTIKRLFLSLEKQGIVLSWTPPGDDQKKYYTIHYECWEEWFDTGVIKRDGANPSQIETGASQKETGPDSKSNEGASQIDPTPGTKNDGSSIYNDSSENTQTLPSENTPTTTPSESRDSAREPAATGDVVDANLDLVLPEIRKLHLTPDAQTELLDHGAQYALAVAWHAQGPGARNPGGLARSMMGNGGPPEAVLKLAAIALELHTIDRDEVDRVLKQREAAALVGQAQQIAYQPCEANGWDPRFPPGQVPSAIVVDEATLMAQLPDPSETPPESDDQVVEPPVAQESQEPPPTGSAAV